MVVLPDLQQKLGPIRAKREVKFAMTGPE